MGNLANFFSAGGGTGSVTKGLGQSGLGLTGTSQDQSQQTQLDPTTRALNQLRLNALQNADSGYAQQNAFNTISGPYQPYGQMDFLNNQMVSQATNPNFDPQAWYNQSYGQLDPSNYSQMLNGIYADQVNNLASQRDQRLQAGAQWAGQGLASNQNIANAGYQAGINTQNQALGQGIGLANAGAQAGLNYQNQGMGQASNFANQGYNTGIGTQNIGFQAGMGTIGGVRNDTLNYINNQMANQAIGAGNSYFNQIMSPQISNEMATMGLARSGANQEAQAKAAANIALGINQQQSQLQGQALSGYQQGATGLSQGYQQGLGNVAGQYGQNLGQIGNTYQQGLGQVGSNYQGGLTALGTGYQQGTGQVGNIYQQGLNQAGQQYAGQLSDLYNQGYNQYGQGIQQAMNNNFQGQQALGQQYLNNLYGLNQAMPNASINAQNAQMNRLNTAYQAQQVPQQWAQQGYENAMNRYIAALNGTPYTPATTIKTTGTKDEGILDSQFGAAFGQGLGSGISDKRAKRSITKFSSQDFLDTLEAFSYEYKNPTHGTGRFNGIMAQDLLESELGKQFVIFTPEGYKVDYQRMSSTLLACLVDINKRVKELEHAGN